MFISRNLFWILCCMFVKCFNLEDFKITRLQDIPTKFRKLRQIKTCRRHLLFFLPPGSGPQEWWMLLKEKRNSIYSCLSDSQCWVEDSFHNLGEWKGPSAVLLIRENKVHFMKDCLKVAIETTFYWVINYRDFKRLLLWAFYSFLIESLLSGLVCTDLVVKRQSSLRVSLVLV